MDKIRVTMTKVPFNFKHPRSAKVSVVRNTGNMMLDANIAKAAIDGGYATRFKADPTSKRRAKKTADDKGGAEG